MTEIWKDIPGYNGRYKVSSLGRVANDKGKHLKVDINQKGYARVQLTKGGKKSNIKVHRLVAEAFIPNPYGLPQVNHIDEDKLNNSVGNLCWVDNRTNTMLNSNRTHRPRPVEAFSVDGDKIGRYESMAAASRATGIDKYSISAACLGTQKVAGGYIWKYA